MRGMLLNFKKSLNDTKKRLASWNSEDCCSWEGVFCNNLTGHVVRLDLRNPHPFSDDMYTEWSLSGQLCPSLLGLKQLNHLDLSMNHFDGPIPMFLGSLRNLRYLNFSLAGFHGLIPHQLGNLSRLKYLDLHNNNFFGSIPDALKNLNSLLFIDFSSNNFDGFLPDWFGEMHKLENIFLEYNLLFGSIPESWGQLVALQALDLSGNKLNGTVPKSIGQLVALQFLALSSNKLGGTVPKSIGQLSNLVVLDLVYNFFEGVISEVHFTRLAKLSVLIIGSRNLLFNVSHDWIPPFQLDILDIEFCKIGPDFPQWLETQVHLSTLTLRSANIVDILPDWFWDVFVTYDVSSVSLNLMDNGITGKLPPLSKLIAFDFFILSSNFFEGPLPSSLNARGGTMFDVSKNSFSGSIQPILGNISVTFLSLSKNNFSGEIPLSICSVNASLINLSWNHFTGELPNCWNPLPYPQRDLSTLDFSRNNLYGTIPITFGTLTGLQSLHLSYNNLSGSIPMTLKNLVNLKTLDLGMNNLTGIIPTWIVKDLTLLEVLTLKSNNFMGNVPSDLSKLKELRILDLANNKLTGRIPWSFGSFKVKKVIHPNDANLYNLTPSFLEYIELTVKKRYWNYDKLLTQITTIDLSFNNLSEKIPKELGNLHGLMNLNLSGNHLVGSIPDAIGLMHSLETLDLSRNELSGNIPSNMSTMTALDFLNLSYNDLSGKIPSGPQLQTLPNESYIGNPKLCGFPLSRSCDSNKTSYVEGSEDEVTESDYWYASIAPGFVLGVWIVMGTFLVMKKWRRAYFRYVDYVYDAIYVFTIVNINRFKRKTGNETVLD